MDWVRLGSFSGMTFLLLLLPGPSVCFTLAVALRKGARAAIPAIFGQAAANVAQLSIAASGLLVLLQRFPGFLLAARWGGVGYMAYLGFRQWRGTGPAPSEAPARPDWDGAGRLFRDGFLTCALNPQAIVFLGAFLPLFLDGHRSLGRQLSVLGTICVLEGILVLIAYALAAGLAQRWLERRGWWRLQSRLTGAAMFAGGLLLVLAG